MRFLTAICRALLIAAALLPGAVRAASFSVSLDHDSVTLGDPITLSLKFDDISPDGPPALPNISGLNFQYLGPSTSFQMMNGVTTSSTTYNYQVVPQHVGQFTIPGLSIRVNGQDLASSPVTLTVNKAEAPTPDELNSGNQVAFLRLRMPRTHVYLGETVMANLDLYLRDDVLQINGFNLTSTGTDGFSTGKLSESGGQHQARVGNHVYKVLSLTMPLTPLRDGSFSLGPFTATVNVILPPRNQGGDPFFRAFFNQGEQSQVNLATDSLNVDCSPLPITGRPADFSGAIGNFSMNVTAGPSEVAVGDPITVRVQISGRGSLQSLSLPLPATWHDFKAYPPTTKFEPSDAAGFQGTKTFEQIITPLNSDVHELPAFSFSFFNPDDGQYHTLSHAAVPLIVHPATGGALPASVAAKPASGDNNNNPPQDIIPVREELGTLSAQTEPWVGRPVFWVFQSVPVLAFCGVLVWRRRSDLLANNPRLRRQRQVAQLTATGLADLQRHAAANQPDEFFQVLFRLLQEQLGERLDTPAGGITAADLDRLTSLGAAPPLRENLRELFQLCDQARYAPTRGSSELGRLAAKFQQTVQDLQTLKR